MTYLKNDKDATEKVTGEQAAEIWRLLSAPERVSVLEQLPREQADELFMGLTSAEQAAIILLQPQSQQRSYLRLLAPDDVVDVLQRSPRDTKYAMLQLLDERTRAESIALLRYEEDAAGGLMNPRYVRLRPDMTTEEALWYIRRQADAKVETIYVAYVLDTLQHLLGVVTMRQLLQESSHRRVEEYMKTRVYSVLENATQEEVSRVFADKNLHIMPVVDEQGIMKGVVTVDDIMDVVQEEATEDIQRLAGVETLDDPYAQAGFWQMLRKRGGWLTVLFFSEMLTTTALTHYQSQLERAMVLVTFLPLLSSAGGNSGSQSTALVVRALTLGEIKLRDWWLVMLKELRAGFGLGALLGGIGCLRILVWQYFFGLYGEHALLIGLCIGVSLVFVVMWGTLAGAMLPFILSRLGFDPVTSSAPFVATFVDVTAIMIYLQISRLILQGTLL